MRLRSALPSLSILVSSTRIGCWGEMNSSSCRSRAVTPRRLTPESFTPVELSPAWSADGRWIAFTSFDDEKLGHVWKIPAAGGQMTQLTKVAGEYLQPAWAPDGRELVVTRGTGGFLHDRAELSGERELSRA
mgnify:CR=1 FL=1